MKQMNESFAFSPAAALGSRDPRARPSTRPISRLGPHRARDRARTSMFVRHPCIAVVPYANDSLAPSLERFSVTGALRYAPIVAETRGAGRRKNPSPDARASDAAVASRRGLKAARARE